MIVDAPSPSVGWEAASDAARGSFCSLAAIAPGDGCAVVAIELEPELLRWLAGLGIDRGDRVTVLRRAPFGGPIHLRTHTGGEFAVARSLALRIHVDPVRAEEPKGSV
ncbi:Hypothetical protein A7982_04612 [Minicystis rosea]|nr:Hypothetical protein A7982_04612 [Minicystis rosea]